MAKSLLDHAYDYVSQSKEQVSFKDLWAYVCKEAGLDEAAALNREKWIHTVYGAVPIDFNNYMPVVHHYDGNTVMFGITNTQGEEDVTVGVRDNYAADRQHSWAVLDNFELYYISPNIVSELNKEWKKRVAIVQSEYDVPSKIEPTSKIAIATNITLYFAFIYIPSLL